MNDRYRIKGRRILVNTLVLALLFVLGAGLAFAQKPGPGEKRTPQTPLGTGFTYQGQLKTDDGPVSDDCSMAFRLYDDPGAGSQVGSAITATVPISNGLFAVNLDFGDTAFTGDARWMGIKVKCTDDDSFADMGRLELTAAPYALYTLEAPWSGLTGVPTGFADGVDDVSAVVSGTSIFAGDGLTQIAGGDSVTIAVDFAGTGAADTAARSDHDHWGESWTGSGIGLTLSGGSTGLSGNGTSTGVLGSASSTTGRGVHGYVDASSGENYGVYGRSASTGGRGVYGYANADSGTTYGVYGVADSPDGRGVYGYASATSGVNYGVRGESESSIGRGVAGYGLFGVYGESDSTSGSGVFGSTTATSGTTYGVQDESDSTSGRGVFGSATATSGTTYGVWGEADSTSGRGVYGYASATSGINCGVYGESASSAGLGVWGSASATSGHTYGVYGESHSPDGYGVRGYNGASSGNGAGVYGESDSTSGSGVYGTGRYGIYGESNSSNGYGGYFVNSGSDGVALYATGDGSGRDNATLRVDNTEETGGVTAYVTNDSNYATAHFYNAGSGEVLYLQNGGTDAGGAGGGDFIRAVNEPEGDVQFRVSTSGYVYADGGYRCGQNISDVPLGPASVGQNEGSLEPCLQDSTPADFAEMLPAIGSLEPGDVLVIGPDGNLTQSSEPYQTTIAGVYSFRPSFLGNAQFADEDGYAPLALLGVVPVKASAENGSIQPGDLLVASSTPGHAMKAGENPPQGTVIGKALGPLNEGTGFIQMLVTLQ